MEDFTKYENLLTNRLKSILKQEGLVESGKLYNSIEVKIEDSEVVVKAEDYYKYLDRKHNLTAQLMDSREMKDFISAYIADLLTNNLSNN